MANLLDTPSFTANEVYEIAATDSVEGAATGASFNGIGVSNQPHQQLANRTAFLKQRQDTNIANLAALQNFVGLFKGLMGPSGYMQVPFVDVSRGLIAGIVEWGFFAIGQSFNIDTPFVIEWPLQFPSACQWAIGAPGRSTTTNTSVDVIIDTVSFTQTQGTFVVDTTNGTIVTMPGFYWIAIGF